MTDMVERVARRLCRLYYRGLAGPKEPSDSKWELFTDDARDIIPAVFQVTDEDAQVFFDEPEADTEWLTDAYEASARTFDNGMRALNNAALKEGT